MMNLFTKFNYKDLLTSVKFYVLGLIIVYSRFSIRTTFIGMAHLNAISLQMFQSKMKISPPVLPVSFAEHLWILKRHALSAMIITLIARQ